MDKKTVFQNLVAVGIVPVIRSSSAKNVLLAIKALMEGGIPVAEVTMTVPNALAAIEECAREFGGHLTLGAGTVTDEETCRKAIEAGSQFIVTPSVKTDIIRICVQNDVCVIGGALTPTEILTVWEAGAAAVKVFPAKAVGGPAYLRMIREPLPHIPLVPTGGVTLETLPEYLGAGAAFVGAGGDLVNKGAVEAGKAELITERARQYVAAIRAARSGGR